MPCTRCMCSKLLVTRTPSSAMAWAAIAVSKSSIRVPLRSRSALIVPKARLTSSVQTARRSSPARTSKRSRSRLFRFELRSLARPYSISAITGCGTRTSVRRHAVSLSLTVGSPRIRYDRILVSSTYFKARAPLCEIDASRCAASCRPRPHGSLCPPWHRQGCPRNAGSTPFRSRRLSRVLGQCSGYD